MLEVGGVYIRTVAFRTSSPTGTCFTCSLVGSGESGPKIFSRLILISFNFAGENWGVMNLCPGPPITGMKLAHSSAVCPLRRMIHEKLWHDWQFASILRISLSLLKAEM